MSSFQYHALADDGTEAWPSLTLRNTIATPASLHTTTVDPANTNTDTADDKTRQQAQTKEKKDTYPKHPPCYKTPTTTEEQQRLCVLLTTGAMNPIHRGHIAMMVVAKTFLEQKHGYRVIAGYVSPSHDRYVGPKSNRNRKHNNRKRGSERVGDKASTTTEAFANAQDRVTMCQLAIQNEQQQHWLDVGTWEARQTTRQWPDYPEVLDNLTQHVLSTTTNTHNLPPDTVVFYVCGADHGRYCSSGFGHPNQGLVVVYRTGYDTVCANDTDRLVFSTTVCSGKDYDDNDDDSYNGNDSGGGSYASLSSTIARKACAQGDLTQLYETLHTNVADHIIKRGLYGYRRPVFISASALAYAWRTATNTTNTNNTEAITRLRRQCETALFFFGSKRSWLFPTNPKEYMESRKQGRYEPPFFPTELLDLIRVKELRSEVWFLKPADLVYQGFGTGCHPPDPTAPVFQKVSDWLLRLGYAPLRLDRDWWMGGKDGYGSCQSRTGVSGRAVVENYEIGEHDYDDCIELLYQSNPTRLDPLLKPPVVE